MANFTEIDEEFICENCGTIYDVMNIDYEMLQKSLNLNEEFILNKIKQSSLFETAIKWITKARYIGVISSIIIFS